MKLQEIYQGNPLVELIYEMNFLPTCTIQLTIEGEKMFRNFALIFDNKTICEKTIVM